MKRSSKGLLPHRETQIILSKADKIIFGISCAVYGTAVVLEEKFHRRNAVSSSFAIMAVGVFLIAREAQNLKNKKPVTVKEKIKLWLWLAVGAVLGAAGVISLVLDIYSSLFENK